MTFFYRTISYSIYHNIRYVPCSDIIHNRIKNSQKSRDGVKSKMSSTLSAQIGVVAQLEEQ
ncbi:hypothetical protein DXC64_27010 [Klebsiella pneumoniae]|nr:hypothetical protein DXC64_27010 [Klebsiella pneumoniae]